MDSPYLHRHSLKRWAPGPFLEAPLIALLNVGPNRPAHRGWEGQPDRSGGARGGRRPSERADTPRQPERAERFRGAFGLCDRNQSYRSATIGSTRDARRAGRIPGKGRNATMHDGRRDAIVSGIRRRQAEEQRRDEPARARTRRPGR